MPATVSKSDYAAMLMGAVGQIRQNNMYLSELDAAIGDGDHGSTILKVMNNLAAALVENKDESLKDLVFNAGMAAASTDGGSSAPLIGSFFMGMADAMEGKESLDAAGVSEAIAGGVRAVQEDSKAKIGDKTMMDALIPVLNFIEANPASGDIKTLMERYAQIARDGAEATKQFVAKFGRARNLGDRVIGHPDAGAHSIAFIFKGMAEAL